jgi:hypothetical protein
MLKRRHPRAASRAATPAPDANDPARAFQARYAGCLQLFKDGRQLGLAGAAANRRGKLRHSGLDTYSERPADRRCNGFMTSGNAAVSRGAQGHPCSRRQDTAAAWRAALARLGRVSKPSPRFAPCEGRILARLPSRASFSVSLTLSAALFAAHVCHNASCDQVLASPLTCFRHLPHRFSEIEE